MIYLDTTTRKLQAVLAGAHATTAPKIVVFFYDVPAQTKDDNSEYHGSTQVATTNGSTDVDICAAPSFIGTTRNIPSIMVHNIDTASITLTIKIDDATVEAPLWKGTLATLECLSYEHGLGWQATTAAGARK